MSPEYYEARILAERVGEFRAQRKVDRDLRRLGEPSVAAEMVGHDAITLAQEPALHVYLAGVLHASGKLDALYDCAVSHAYAWNEMDTLLHLDPVTIVEEGTQHWMSVNRPGVNWFRPIGQRRGERVDHAALLAAWIGAVPESMRDVKSHWWGRGVPNFHAADGRPVVVLADAEAAARRLVRRALTHAAHTDEPRPFPELGTLGSAIGEYALGIAVREELTQAAHECAVRHAHAVKDVALLVAVGEAQPAPTPAPSSPPPTRRATRVADMEHDQYAHLYQPTP